LANKDHLEVLERGVDAWNEWRRGNPGILPNLRQAKLRDRILRGANLQRADLSNADLSDAKLDGMTDLSRASLRGADLSNADLRGADFSGADLSNTNLKEANLSGTTLLQTDLSYATFDDTNLSQAFMAGTKFGGVDLSRVKGLDNVNHRAPSIIGIDTLYRSRGNAFKVFLECAGVPNDFITTVQPLVVEAKFYSCFISYSTKDQEFADQLYAGLKNKGVPSVMASKDMPTGEPFNQRIEDWIRTHDRFV
jgi:Pentapeptide repeats (8 copies)/TIR domain